MRGAVELGASWIDLDVGEVVVHQDPGSVVGADTDGTEGDDLLIFIELIQTAAELTERNIDSTRNFKGSDFCFLTDIQQQSSLVLFNDIPV